MCGICGVSFEQAHESQAATEEEKEEGTEEEKGAADTAGGEAARRKEEHLNFDQHRSMEINYNIFREAYHSTISEPLLEIGAFLSHCQVKKLYNSVYADLPYQVTTVYQLLDSLRQMLNFTIQERRWSDRHHLIQQRHALVQFFHKNVRPEVWQRFKGYQLYQKQTAASREAERQHQERLTEDMVEDPHMSEILDVVDRPAQQQAPQNAAGGGGLIGAVYHSCGRGRGHRGGRGAGRYERRDRGGNEELGQFQRSDLPHRFRKK